jgi:hypothetical protein
MVLSIIVFTHSYLTPSAGTTSHFPRAAGEGSARLDLRGESFPPVPLSRGSSRGSRKQGENFNGSVISAKLV